MEVLQYLMEVHNTSITSEWKPVNILCCNANGFIFSQFPTIHSTINVLKQKGRDVVRYDGVFKTSEIHEG